MKYSPYEKEKEYLRNTEIWQGDSNDIEVSIWDNEIDIAREIIKDVDLELLKKLVSFGENFRQQYVDDGFAFENMMIDTTDNYAIEVFNAYADISLDEKRKELWNWLHDYTYNRYTEEEIDEAQRRESEGRLCLIDRFPRFNREAFKALTSISTPIEELREKQIGDTVKLGLFLQDNEYNLTPIEWTVLANERGHLLLVSKNILAITDVMDDEKIIWQPDWETTYMYRYMNDYLLNVMFDENEKRRVDYVFGRGSVYPLSLKEYEKYKPLLSKDPAKDIERLPDRGFLYNDTWVLRDLYDDGEGVYGIKVLPNGETETDFLGIEGCRPVISYNIKNI